MALYELKLAKASKIFFTCCQCLTPVNNWLLLYIKDKSTTEKNTFFKWTYRDVLQNLLQHFRYCTGLWCLDVLILLSGHSTYRPRSFLRQSALTPTPPFFFELHLLELSKTFSILCCIMIECFIWMLTIITEFSLFYSYYIFYRDIKN